MEEQLLPNLASTLLGAGIVFATDEWFANLHTIVNFLFIAL
jgi:allantoicase